MALGAHVPARLGRYELLARLATGGMGEIFLARLEGAAGFEKLFVVKRILPHLADDARFRSMLIAEARIASKLSHANICQVYELGETDGQLYIVMEYLEGITLLPLLRKASREQSHLELGLVGGVIQQVADALHYAHELRDRDHGSEPLGIVHRDVTPANIFLTDSGVAKVLDFGIAKVKNASAHTQTGTVKGKYAYMAPEQLRGNTVDRRADVFALGVVTYEMLALRRLFQRKTDYLTFRAVMEQPIPDIRRYREIPDSIAEILGRALERDPDQRFESARAFSSAFMDALAPVGRPWTQGEVSDFVRENFATDIAKRSEQVASAIHRTKTDSIGGGRKTMPLIVSDDEPEISIDEDLDDEEFPPVESTASELPRDQRAATPSDFQGVTPPPFGNDSSTSGHQLQPLQPQLTTTPPPAATKRNVMWPILAIAMIAVAGGALFLVWRQMQMQQQPQQVVNITSEPADNQTPPDPTPDPSTNPSHAPADASVETTPDAATAAAKPDARQRPHVPHHGVNPYNAAIQPYRSKIARCGQQHGAAPSNARVVIVVTTRGRARKITLEPGDLNTSPLGTCIKSVLSNVRFPTADEDKQVAIKLITSG